MSPRSVAIPLLALAPTVAEAQSPLYHLGDEILTEVFDPAIHSVGDVDGDGTPDFVVAGLGVGVSLTLVSGETGTAPTRIQGSPERSLLLVDLDGDGILEYVSTTSIYSSGVINVRQGGPNGILHYSMHPPVGSTSFGVSVTVVGDLDHDGVLDLAVPAPMEAVIINGVLLSGIGKVFCYSGRDGTHLGTCSPMNLALDFGTAVTGIPDVDGDGTDDLVIGARGRAFVYSGADMSFIRELGSRSIFSRFGACVADVGDLDLDGIHDVAVGAPFGEWPRLRGLVDVFSGATGVQLFSLEGDQNDQFGSSISGGSDLDGDGVADFVVGAPQRTFAWSSGLPVGYLRAFSGADGHSLFTVSGSQPGEGFGSQVEVIGDVNGDGAADIATARAYLAGVGSSTPFVEVISGRPLMLTTGQHTLPSAGGGRQEFRVDAGQVHAGDQYFVLGSLDRSPGIQLHGVTIPLQADGWLNVSLQRANTALFVDTLGQLDGAGRASAALQLPLLNLSALQGLTLYHAALILRDGQLLTASAAVPVTLVE